MDKQKDKIVSAMRTDPERVWYAKDFQGGGVSFIGYEAWPRLCELVDDGLVERVWYNGRFMGFRLLREPREPVVRIKKRKIIEPVEPEGVWTPSNEDLQALWFQDCTNPLWLKRVVNNRVDINYSPDCDKRDKTTMRQWPIWLLLMYGNSQEIFPTSKKKVIELIELFSKPR